jgi:prephenate dehydrogenase
MLSDRVREVLVADLAGEAFSWESVASHELVLLAVPISAMDEVAGKLGPRIGSEGAVIDVCSTKEIPMRLMMESFECQVLGTHPFFGPGVRSLRDRTVFTCPGRAGDLTRWFERVLSDEGAILTEMDPTSHDRLMSRVQVLRQAVLLAAAGAMGRLRCSPGECSGVAGETTSSLLALMLRQMEENPLLWADMWMYNSYTSEVLESLDEALEEARRWFEKGAGRDLAETIRRVNKDLSGGRLSFSSPGTRRTSVEDLRPDLPRSSTR